MLLALCLSAALMVPAMAEDKGAYVMMNIPYADFYAAECDVAVDAVTSATLMKPRAGALVDGSYHVDPEGSDISALANLGGVEITDDSSVDITVTLKGEEQTTTYTGMDALFEAPDYSRSASTSPGAGGRPFAGDDDPPSKANPRPSKPPRRSSMTSMRTS